ncbi:MAG: UDP-3-O-acyl-N-acetylglucosamine deacetylase [Myxococcota bacterium]|nr:UDP-3-O-acyl-N-acetylglucosamine deacetylase [Myxococcota bacterium]
MQPQATLRAPVSIKGLGLHTGAACQVRLLPAPIDQGRVFCRTDLAGHPEVTAHLDSVVQTTFATTLAKGEARVGTVEHLLAALHALSIDNLRIEIDGPELPALDGSSQPWVEVLDQGGIAAQPAPQRPLRPTRHIEVRDGDRVMSIEPAEQLSLEVEVDYPHPQVGQQRLSFQVESQAFRAHLAWARTFGFASELETLRRQGLILGGSLDNAVVYDAEGLLNTEGLRAPDEIVRHKTLDIIGDLSLLGQPLQAHIVAVRPGHTMTIALLKALTADPKNLQSTD